MLREFLYLQTIAVAMTIPVFQPETQSESIQTLKVLPTLFGPTAEPKSFLEVPWLSQYPVIQSNFLKEGRSNICAFHIFSLLF